MKVAIFCAAGMSTSILVQKTMTAANNRGIDLDFKAYPESQMQKLLGKTDLVLLGPQIGYKKDKAVTLFAPYHIPVDVVPMRDYGTMNGENVLEQILNLMHH
jgi:PTS system cellobiose-specific IIB component